MDGSSIILLLLAALGAALSIAALFGWALKQPEKVRRSQGRIEIEKQLIRHISCVDPWEEPTLISADVETNYFDPWESPQKVIERRSNLLRSLGEERQNLKESSFNGGSTDQLVGKIQNKIDSAESHKDSPQHIPADNCNAHQDPIIFESLTSALGDGSGIRKSKAYKKILLDITSDSTFDASLIDLSQKNNLSSPISSLLRDCQNLQGLLESEKIALMSIDSGDCSAMKSTNVDESW